jgi:signal transduction histidine kinase/CheY-like chemotaxis protein
MTLSSALGRVPTSLRRMAVGRGSEKRQARIGRTAVDRTAGAAERDNSNLAAMPRPQTKNWFRPLLVMLMPPARFRSDSLERAFIEDYAHRFAAQRRTGMFFGLFMWASYIGWDWWHAIRNPQLQGLFPTIFYLRYAGIVLLVALCAAALHPFFDKERFANSVLVAGLTSSYTLLLIMMMILPFPTNYLYYFVGLIMAMAFLSGVLRIRAVLGIILNILSVIAGAIAFQYSYVGSYDSVFSVMNNYYAWAATTYLISFAFIGWVVVVELERTARNTFARERELTQLTASLAEKNSDLESTNHSLNEAQADLEARTDALVAVKEEMRLRAERENINKSRFLAAAAHDLRQPVQALSHYLEAADYAGNDGSLAKCCEYISRAQGALSLTRASFRAILDLSELEIGAVRPRYSTFDLQDLLEEIVAAFQGMAQRRQMQLRVRRRSGSPVVVRSDRHLLARVLENLVSNAIKYSDPRKGAAAAVLVGVVGLPNRTRVDVVDNGIGIAKSQWAKVFDPFVQVNNPTRDREKGFGLGLSIVNAIMPLLEGHRIDMASVEGRGTRFSVEVARSDEPASGPDLSAELHGATFPELAGSYVLYVEDDTLVARSTAAMFDGCGVLHEIVASVAELSRRVKMMDRMPDITITDYRLPDGCNAGDAIRVVREAFGHGMPVIVLTGEVAELEDEAWYAPEICILRKPISPKALLEKIRGLSQAANSMFAADASP